ncbi:RHS repeat protein [Sediminibacter sp. Hel_I_10]|uniref:RHS repeat protein n=1 Tax=Sediminibacter sp. Hel_I_10 TaxID=1392490 RepID=UPI00047958E6|nr:RHS repeat protein [Sediminibacter sp. Hel_I_10]
MKKALFILGIFTITLFSCSSDDDGTEPSQTLKLTKVNKGLDTSEISYLENEKPQAIINPDNTIIPINYNSDSNVILFNEDTYTYDASGRIANITNARGESEFTYDSQGRIITQEVLQYDNNNLTINMEDLRFIYNFTYNNESQLTEVTSIDNIDPNIISVPDITKSKFTYNANGQLIKQDTETSFDNGATFSPDLTIDIIYDTSKNPLRLFYNSMGVTSNFTPFYSSNLDIQLTVGIGNGTGTLYYISKNSPLNVVRTNISPTGNISRTTTFNYQLDGDYPVNGERTFIANPQVFPPSTTQLSWEYTTD